MACKCNIPEPFYRLSPTGRSGKPSVSVYNVDARALLSALPDASADIIFLDPPFNLGKKYGTRSASLDKMPEAEYEQFLEAILQESARVLAVGGALFMYHLPRVAIKASAILAQELTFRHWIAVSMKNGFVRGDRLYPAHYSLLYFTKGDAAHFIRPKVPVKICRHCSKQIPDYGGYAGKVGNFINLSDIWDDLSPVRHKNTKTRRGNELPALLYRRILQISGAPGLLYLDPFCSSGTGALLAFEEGLSVIAGDLDAESLDILVARLEPTLCSL